MSSPRTITLLKSGGEMSTNIRQRDDIVTFSPSLGSSPDGHELGSLQRRWLNVFTG